MKKHYYYIFISIVCSITVVALLFSYSVDKNINKSSFTRNFPPHFTSVLNTLYFKQNAFYIAGISSSHVYLGDYTKPNHILEISELLNDSQTIYVKVPENVRIAWRVIRVFVDSPDIYLMEGVTPKILHYKMAMNSFEDVSNVDEVYYSSSVPVSPNTFVLRTYDTTQKQHILSKLNTGTGEIYDARKVLEKQIDGRFCTDGLILSAPQSRMLVYVYFYRNQYICLDTNLNILYRSKTIDTISKAQLKLDTVSNEHMVTFSSPPLMVNKSSCISNNLLFIHSNLMSKNEIEKDFKMNSVIDMYSLEDGRYKYSFYIPNHEGKRIKYFQVINSTLIAIYENLIIAYHLNI